MLWFALKTPSPTHLAQATPVFVCTAADVHPPCFCTYHLSVARISSIVDYQVADCYKLNMILVLAWQGGN